MTPALLTEELDGASTEALLLPLVGTLILTGALAALVCQPPPQARPLPVLFALAASYMGLAAVGHAGAVWLVQRLFEDVVPWPTKAIIVGLWSTVAWLPLLTLLTSRDSLWVAGTLPLIINCVVSFLGRASAEPEAESTVTSATLFVPGNDAPFWRALLPSALASAALEAGVFALLFQHEWLAGTLFAGSCTLPVWRSVRAPQSRKQDSAAASVRNLLRTSAVAWLLTTVALLPFAKSALLAKAFPGWYAKPHTTASSIKPKSVAHGGRGDLQFVVLLQPPRPREKRLPPPPEVDGGQPQSTEPSIIPFDGPYWFFKHAGDQPPVTARQERGDPRKVNVRSTDGLPILMEAHQNFAPPLHVASANALRVDITNADDRPGATSVEVLLEGHQKGVSSTTSLGTLLLPSSKDPDLHLGRAPVQDSVIFPITAAARHVPMDAITIRFKPDAS